jgi:cyclopropane fatty-acyl-phospholipid synthase-like methyltransferase
MNKPFSQSCENNKKPILSVIESLWTGSAEILEIGSGTGQHAVYFAAHLPHLHWQPSDRGVMIEGMHMWFDEAGLSNIRPPQILDVELDPWPVTRFDGVFTANTLHIMSWNHVQLLFHRLGTYLPPGGLFVCYGPFNRGGQYSSESNARFDQWLKRQDPVSAIRDIDDLEQLAVKQEIELESNVDMPANNRILVWKKSPVAGIQF